MFVDKLLVKDKCMLSLQGKLEKLAEHLILAANNKKRFVLRYHNDADGISAGLSVYRALKAQSDELAIVSIPSQSAVYKLGDALMEIGNLGDASNAVFIILDHGANPESVSALKMLRSAGIELVIIDHHPHDKEAEQVANYFISPLNHEGNSSHTVGLICYELARLMDEESADVNLAYYSLQGDKSTFALKDREFKEPIAIDYIANFEELPLPFYEKTLKNKEMVNEAYLQAREKIENAMRLAEKFTDIRDYGGYAVVIVKVSKFLRKGEFPTRGKIMNEIIAKNERLLNKPLVCIGITDDGVSFRANQSILQKGFDANKLIQELKVTFSGEIINGGGHSAAAALQANSDAMPAIIKEMALLIGKQLK